MHECIRFLFIRHRLFTPPPSPQSRASSVTGRGRGDVVFVLKVAPGDGAQAVALTREGRRGEGGRPSTVRWATLAQSYMNIEPLIKGGSRDSRQSFRTRASVL